MTEVLSCGDHIRQGRYRLHSKFPSAVNFMSGADFVFVVTGEVGAGPCSIVVRSQVMDTWDSLEIHEDYFLLNREKLYFRESLLYDSSIGTSGYDGQRVGKNLEHFENALIRFASPKSIAFLLDAGGTKGLTSSFEREYRTRFIEGYAKIFSDDFLTGIDVIRGLGPGLTPSGDDCISGILIALNVLQKALPADFASIIEAVHAKARGTNPFVNTFLNCAAHGLISGKCKELIHALLCEGEAEVSHCTMQLLRAGETSGADQGVGLLTGFKRFMA